MPDPQMALPPGATLVGSAPPSMALPPGAKLVSGGVSTQTLDPSQPGMQPSAAHADPVEYFGRGLANSKNALGNFIDTVKDAIDHPENHQTVHNAQGIRAKVQAILDLNNPLPKDEGQGTVNRVAEGAGNATGQAIQGEAALHAPEAIGDTVIGAAKAAAKAVPAVAKVARFANPDVVGVFSPRAAHAARLLGRLDDVLQKAQPSEASPAAAPSAPPDTSVPASSLSMTQFPPPMPKDPIAAAPIKVKAILDDAHAQIQQVVEDAKKSTPTKDQPAAPGSREDKLDDRGITQEMGWDLARHYYKGMAEQRDMAASATSSKTELTTQAKVDTILAKAADDARTVLESAKIPAEGTKARIAGRIPASWVKDGKIALPKPGDDLVDLLQRSVDAAKAKKGPGSGGEGNGGAK